ncbi:hypothetical protein EDF34_2740 [Cellulomonas sp. PhB150]|nr:hypothetical protein EDF34_2740 [Cellulomonas sp. PhB150]
MRRTARLAAILAPMILVVGQSTAVVADDTAIEPASA